MKGFVLFMMLFVSGFFSVGKLHGQGAGPARYKAYEGQYRSRDDSDNQVRLIAVDTNLVMRQLWDGKELRFYPINDTYFYNAQWRYPLYILKGDSGRVKSILLMGREHFERVGP